MEDIEGKWQRHTILKLAIQPEKLPLQSTSSTVKQIVKEVEIFLTHTQTVNRHRFLIQDQRFKITWEKNNTLLPTLIIRPLTQTQASTPKLKLKPHSASVTAINTNSNPSAVGY